MIDMNNFPRFEQTINEISIQCDGIYTFIYKGIEIETLIQNSEINNGNLFILLSGARDPTSQPVPKFDRWKWKGRFPGVMINISDPSLHLNEQRLRIGWYIGSRDVNYTSIICEVVSSIARELKIKKEKIIFYGSSAGGFAAIRMSTIVDGSTAIAINPQIDIRKYIYSQYLSFIKHSYHVPTEELTGKDISRFDATIELKQNSSSRVIYAQNILDHSHFKDHYSYFCNEMKIEHLGGCDKSSRFHTVLFSSQNGHGAEPNNLVPELINRALKPQAIGNIPPPPPSSNSIHEHINYCGAPPTNMGYNALDKFFCICKNKQQINSINLNECIPIALDDDFSFYCSNKLRHKNYARDEKKIILIGICIDINNSSLDEETIAINMLTRWQSSKSEFEEALFSLAGSFLFVIFDKEIFIYPDACGTYSISYSKFDEDFAVSSHPRLVAEIIGKSTSPFKEYWVSHKSFSAGGQYYPGNLTEFESCLQLTPNTFISSKQHRIPSRFFPITKIETRNIDYVLKRIKKIIDAQIKNLVSRFNINISLSGGLDSRVTLAAFDGHTDKVNFFTYKIRSNPSLKQDLDIANSLSKHFNLKHKTIDIKYSDKIPSYIYKELDLISPGNYAGADLTWAYTCNFDKDSIHVRSNLMEIIRGYYLKNPANVRNAYTPKKISSLFRGGSRDEFIGVFDQFLRDVQFYKISGKNYHYSDIFYWEHRMGIFVSNVVRRERPIMDTVMLFNNHELISLGLSLSVDERKNADLLWKYMEEKSPRVLDIPFSSGGVLFSSIRHKLKI